MTYRESLSAVDEFYSSSAHYPLRELKPGQIVVSGSDVRKPEEDGTVLCATVFEDRCVVSVWRDFVDGVEGIARALSPSSCLSDGVRAEFLQLCRERLTKETVCSTYVGVKLYCNQNSYVCKMDENVRPITRQNAGEVITSLLEDGIPDAVDYLLKDDAAFVYFLDGRPVAFAGTHPVGSFNDRIGNVMVGTHEGYRMRGCGKGVVSATTGRLLDQGRIAVYGTSEDNAASIATARAVGYQPYCQVYQIRIAAS